MADFTDELKMSLIVDATQVDKRIREAKSKLEALRKSEGQKAQIIIRINIAELEGKLNKARAELRKFKKEGDEKGQIVAQLKIKGLQEQKNTANKALRDLQKQADKTKKSFFSLNGIVKDSIKAFAGFFLIRKAGQALRGAFNAAVDFESAFAGVRKTVEATEPEFAKLEKDFRALAKTIPITVEELLKIGELGGQLGVAQEDLIGFTKTIAKIGVTTNLSTEEAATSFARLANVLQIPIAEIENLASATVELGNNFATTEAEIINFATRIAGAGATLGLTGEDLLGIGAAFTSVGIRAEAGGTAVTKVLFKINDAVLAGGKDLEQFAQVTGQTSQEFADNFRNEPVKALDAFVAGLGKAGPFGAQILDELTGGSVRVKAAFLSAASAGDIFSDAIETSNKASQENIALQEEADKRFGTLESRLVLLKSKLNDLGIAFEPIAKGFVIIAETFAEGATLFLGTLGDMIGTIKDIAFAIGTLAGNVVTVLGSFVGLGDGLRSISNEMKELVASAAKSVEATQNLVNVNTRAANVLKGNDQDVADFRAELAKKQLAIDKAAHKIQLALIEDKTDAEVEAAEKELDIAVEANKEFLELNKEKIKKLRDGNRDILVDNQKISDAIVELGEDEVKTRLDLASEFADGNVLLQEAILNATGVASRKELEIMAKKWNSAGALAEQFQSALAALMSKPIFQTIGLILPDGEKLIAAKAAQDFQKSFFKDLKIDFDAGDVTIPSPTKGPGGGAGGALREAEKAAKDAEKAVEDFQKSIEDTNKASRKLRDDIKDFYQDIVDSIDDARQKQSELNKEFADFQSEETAGFVEEAAERDVDLSGEATDLEKEIADLKGEEQQDQEKINEKQQELNDVLKERAQIAEFLKGEFADIDFGVDEEGIAKTAQDVFNDIIELKKLSEFEQSKVALDAAIERKNADIQLEIEKQQGIIDIQEKFLDLQKRNDEEAQRIKKGIIDLATTDEILSAEERAKRLADLGFEDLTKDQESELLKQFVTANALDDELELIQQQQQDILETKQEYIDLTEQAFSDSVDVQIAKEKELIAVINEAIAAQQRLIALGGGGAVAQAIQQTQSIDITQNISSNVDFEAGINSLVNKIQ